MDDSTGSSAEINQALSQCRSALDYFQVEHPDQAGNDPSISDQKAA
jgi:hypothetical protein